MRYTCWTCKTEHDPDNMTAHCAVCVADMRENIVRLRGVIESAEALRDYCYCCDDDTPVWKNLNNALNALKESE